jgi:Bacterial Ig domain/Fibronectin type III domain
VTLGWNANPETDVVGYRIHYGVAPLNYTTVLDVGNITTATVPNLTVGVKYYFAVTAYNAFAIESLPSDEVSYTVAAPPSVTIAINGGNFIAPGRVDLSASVNMPGATIQRVEFFAGGTKIGMDSSSPYTLYFGNVPAGTHSITAVAINSQGGATSSSPVTVTVNPGATSAPPPPGFVVPSVASITRLQGGALSVHLIGTAGQTCDVWVSDNLIHWARLTTVQNASGNLTVTDPDAATRPQRFYRVSAAY